MSKTEQKKNTKINLHIYVLKSLLTFPKEKGGGLGGGGEKGQGEKGSTCLFISLTSEAIQTN